MDSDLQSTATCLFCGGRLRLRYRNVFHPFKHDHGPFDIYVCTDCGSFQTEPMPSFNSLASLYDSYRDGLPNLHRKIISDNPQIALYKLCLNRICRLSGIRADDEFSWLDIGAGGGELSSLMATAFPNSRGVAIDLHPCPTSLEDISAVNWYQVDINQKEFAGRLQQTDLVVSISVWEHVLRPDLFVANLLRLVRPGGMLYLLCPNSASLASRLLGRRWPYFTPGEHLAMPSPTGAFCCLQREWCSFHGRDERINISLRPLMLPYTLRYVMRRLGADAVGLLLPPDWNVPLPAGALETVLVRQATGSNGST